MILILMTKHLSKPKYLICVIVLGGEEQRAVKTIIKLRSAMWNIYNCNRELTLLPTLGCSFSKNMKIYSEWRHKGAMNLWSLTWYVSKKLDPSLNHEQ